MKRLVVVAILFVILMSVGCVGDKAEATHGEDSEIKNSNILSTIFASKDYIIELGEDELKRTKDSSIFDGLYFATGKVNGHPYVFKDKLLDMKELSSEVYGDVYTKCDEWNLVANNEGLYVVRYDGSETIKVLSFLKDDFEYKALGGHAVFGQGKNYYTYNLYDNKVDEASEYDISKIAGDYTSTQVEIYNNIEAKYHNNIQLVHENLSGEYTYIYFEDESYYIYDFYSQYLINSSMITDSYSNLKGTFISDDNVYFGEQCLSYNQAENGITGYVRKDKWTRLEEIVDILDIYLVTRHGDTVKWSDLAKAKDEINMPVINMSFNEEWIVYLSEDDFRLYQYSRKDGSTSLLDIKSVREFRVFDEGVLVATIGDNAGLYLVEDEKVKMISDKEVQMFTYFENRIYYTSTEDKLYSLDLVTYESELIDSTYMVEGILDDSGIFIISREKKADLNDYDDMNVLYSYTQSNLEFRHILEKIGTYKYYDSFVHNDQFVYDPGSVTNEMDAYTLFTISHKEPDIKGKVLYEDDEVLLFFPLYVDSANDEELFLYDKTSNTYKKVLSDIRLALLREDEECIYMYDTFYSVELHKFNKKTREISSDFGIKDLYDDLDYMDIGLKYETDGYSYPLGNMAEDIGLVIGEYGNFDNSFYIKADALEGLRDNSNELIIDSEARSRTLSCSEIYEVYLLNISDLNLNRIAVDGQHYEERQEIRTADNGYIYSNFKDPIILTHTDMEGNGHDGPMIITEIHLVIEKGDNGFYIAGVFFNEN